MLGSEIFVVLVKVRSRTTIYIWESDSIDHILNHYVILQYLLDNLFCTLNFSSVLAAGLVSLVPKYSSSGFSRKHILTAHPVRSSWVIAKSLKVQQDLFFVNTGEIR